MITSNWTMLCAQAGAALIRHEQLLRDRRRIVVRAPIIPFPAAGATL